MPRPKGRGTFISAAGIVISSGSRKTTLRATAQQTEKGTLRVESTVVDIVRRHYARIRQNAPRIVVIGDLMLDEYLTGTVDRISPEAPIPVVRSTSSASRPGGAANVAANAAALGAKVSLIGVIGIDEASTALLTKLRERGIATDYIIKANGRPTTRKLRVVAGAQQIVRVDFEDTAELDPSHYSQLASALSEAIQDADAVIISDYGKGVCHPLLLGEAIRMATSSGIPILCDPKGTDYTKYSGSTLITPNRKEAAEAIGAPLATREQAEAAGSKLRRELGLRACVITLGADGMMMVDGEGSFHIHSFAREVADVTGAGDTVVATLAYGLAQGLSLREAGVLSNAAAGIAVGHVGNANVTIDEIASAHAEHSPAEKLQRKIVKEHAIAGMLEADRARGKKIVFTNGCFDLVHAGHIESLVSAAALGDMLVVGLNSDASVRRLKGPDRPVVNEDNRALVLAGLSAVTYVVVFDADTPLQLIENVRPHVLVKGSDYKPGTVVGEDFVNRSGGRVVLLPLKAGMSTTNLIRAIAGSPS